MKAQEAIEFLKNMIDREAIPDFKNVVGNSQSLHEYRIEALQMGIDAIKRQECRRHTCSSCKHFVKAENDKTVGTCTIKDQQANTRASRNRGCKKYIKREAKK